jgi:hypothetical protein
MIGEALAILSALMQAISTVLSAKALKNVDPIWSNVIKTTSTVRDIPRKNPLFLFLFLLHVNEQFLWIYQI